MWTHLFEASLTGAALFAIPLVLIAALTCALALSDRLFRRRQSEAPPRARSYGGSRSLRTDEPSAMDSNRSWQGTRRNFGAAAIHGIWSAILAALGLPAVTYLLVPSRIQQRDDFVEAGDITRL